jgi:hypothetical protein
VPIAVCISKIDLVNKFNPLAGKALPWIRGLRDSFDRPMTLKELHRRSKLCEEVLPVMFPGWDLTRELKEHFGGRFLFFPLTPVNLEEDELGQKNLKARSVFNPVGVLEPILWLMHMHGFAIFK